MGSETFSMDFDLPETLKRSRRRRRVGVGEKMEGEREGGGTMASIPEVTAAILFYAAPIIKSR